MTPSETPPVRTAFEEVVGSSRQLVLKRLDLLQLEAEQLVEDMAARLSAACLAVLLTSLAFVLGSVALVAWATPHWGLAASAGALAAAYAFCAALSVGFASRSRARKQKEALQ